METLTDERAAELLAERRAAGPATRKQSAKKATAKKATAKKATAKKATAKKATAKKAHGEESHGEEDNREDRLDKEEGHGDGRDEAEAGQPGRIRKSGGAYDGVRHGSRGRRGAGCRAGGRRPRVSQTGRGRLIALEGIDGCGKSTQAQRLADRLGARLTFEPGATDLGASLRQLLLDPGEAPVAERTEALLMAADRAQHVAEVVRPALDAGTWIVTDRLQPPHSPTRGTGGDSILQCWSGSSNGQPVG